jgi:hypothetical protein
MQATDRAGARRASMGSIGGHGIRLVVGMAPRQALRGRWWVGRLRPTP